NGEKISMLAERYDASQFRLDETTRNITKIQHKITAAQAETDRIGTLVTQRAATMYVRSGGQTPLASLDVGTVSEIGSRAKYAESAAASDNDLLDRLRVARADLRDQQDTLEVAQKQARTNLDAISASRGEVEAANQK